MPATGCRLSTILPNTAESKRYSQVSSDNWEDGAPATFTTFLLIVLGPSSLKEKSANNTIM